tara:strand:+ start:4708 stop:4920 length:213 start_codon:yes stop_codon:yes gene_type:complete
MAADWEGGMGIEITVSKPKELTTLGKLSERALKLQGLFRLNPKMMINQDNIDQAIEKMDRVKHNRRRLNI